MFGALPDQSTSGNSKIAHWRAGKYSLSSHALTLAARCDGVYPMPYLAPRNLNASSIAEKVRRLRDHGGLRKYEHDVVGYNSRLDAMQAAVLGLKLKHLDERNARRREHAAMRDNR